MTTTGSSALASDHREAWERDGFFIIRGMIDLETSAALIASAVEIARSTPEQPDAPLVLLAEGHTMSGATEPEHLIAKIFRLHRLPGFVDVVRDRRILEVVASLLGDDLDVFLSQFIFKWPTAYGQPWHQDSYYFPFKPDRQVGVWVAANRATIQNGCLWVLPGSHAEPIHEHVPDTRPNATTAYVEIVDHDMSGQIPVEMEPGDVLFFDSHLMHRSTDNESDDLRAAYVVHYASAGTTVLDERANQVNDWQRVRREGANL